MARGAIANDCAGQHEPVVPVRQIEKILIATDTWQETNGLTTTLRHTLAVGEQEGYTYHVLHPGAFFRFPNPLYPQYWHAFPTPWQVRRCLSTTQPHAVHIATEGPIGLAVRQACRRRGWHYTTSFHTRWDEHARYLAGIPPILGWQWVRWFHERSACVLVPTPSIAALLRAHGFKSPLMLWPKGIDRQRFHPRLKRHLDVPRPILLYVGRISREKNLPAFLDLQGEGTKYVVGAGPLLGRLQHLYRREIAAGRLVFFGEQRGQALADLYAEADVFVFPSKTETFGNVILEALASGVPVAAYPVPGPLDILVGKHVGALQDSLAIAVQQALAEGRPEACLALARQYSWEAATAQFLRAIVPVQSAPTAACPDRPARPAPPRPA